MDGYVATGKIQQNNFLFIFHILKLLRNEKTPGSDYFILSI